MVVVSVDGLEMDDWRGKDLCVFVVQNNNLWTGETGELGGWGMSEESGIREVDSAVLVYSCGEVV